ncbi:MAG: sigma-70 family RNA polymerase sigma factor [Planctomycetes bacterium]|nr:sigma-70 family RNA polymerase sigma factor [Planctomycetota bacterium]
MDTPAIVTTAAATDPADAAILAGLRNGDAAACTEFVRSHAGMALGVARRILRNEADAQDAVQDAFASFFRGLGDFRQQSRLTTWLHRIVVNAALMKRRAAQRRDECCIDELLPSYHADGHRRDPRPEWVLPSGAGSAGDDLAGLVRRKVDELPDDYRVVLVLRDVEELDTEETAEVLGTTPGAVKTRLHRARQALRTLLEREFVP